MFFFKKNTENRLHARAQSYDSGIILSALVQCSKFLSLPPLSTVARSYGKLLTKLARNVGAIANEHNGMTELYSCQCSYCST